MTYELRWLARANCSMMVLLLVLEVVGLFHFW